MNREETDPMILWKDDEDEIESIGMMLKEITLAGVLMIIIIAVWKWVL